MHGSMFLCWEEQPGEKPASTKRMVLVKSTSKPKDLEEHRQVDVQKCRSFLDGSKAR